MSLRAELVLGLAALLERGHERRPLLRIETEAHPSVWRREEAYGLGMPDGYIAANMHISDHTVKFHVNAILTKLGVASRTEAVVQAARRGLVTL